MTDAPVLAFDPGRRTNAQLMADVARLGYLPPEALVLDATYGRGNFWTEFEPDRLISVDWATMEAQVRADFTRLPFPDHVFDVVVLDPPYKLNGTPKMGDFDARYGVDRRMRWQDRHGLIMEAMTEATRVMMPGGLLMLKCKDQVSSGAYRWQEDQFTRWAFTLGLTKIDRLGLFAGPPQPMEGREQKHAHGQPSVLLIFGDGLGYL